MVGRLKINAKVVVQGQKKKVTIESSLCFLLEVVHVFKVLKFTTT
jgi:hypothetical protein